MEPQGSSSHSHGPATCPYSEPDQSKSYPCITPVEDPFLILSSHLRLRLSSGLFSLDFPTKKPRMHLSPLPHSCYMFGGVEAQRNAVLGAAQWCVHLCPLTKTGWAPGPV
jgi:hypothetical protein